MAKGGGGAIIGDFILLAVIVVLVLIALNWIKMNGSNQRAASGVGVGSAGGSGAAGAAAGIGGAALKAWTNLVKAFTQGQTLANTTLGTGAPASNSLLPYITPNSSMNLNQFANPIDYGAGLASLGGLTSSFSLPTVDPSSTSLIPLQSLGSFSLPSYPLS